MLDHDFHYRRNLPRFQPVYATFFITFRLADSMPLRVLHQLDYAHRRAMEELKRLPDPEERRAQTYQEQRRALGKWDAALHASDAGPRWLEETRVAAMLADTLRSGDGRSYSLHAFCIMPNHVHLVLTPLPKERDTFHSLAGILRSIKLHSARQINAILVRSGGVWQHENYNHTVRDEQEYWRIVEYVLNNPVKAGLAREWQEWPWNYVAQVS
jgi:REP element-mobilizing transposase RayT